MWSMTEVGWRSVAASTLSPMANFAVRLVHGPGWDPSRPTRVQDGWDEHAAFMDGLVDDGFVILGGPVGDDGEQTLHVVEAADETISRRASPEIPGLQPDCFRSAR